MGLALAMSTKNGLRGDEPFCGQIAARYRTPGYPKPVILVDLTARLTEIHNVGNMQSGGERKIAAARPVHPNLGNGTVHSAGATHDHSATVIDCPRLRAHSSGRNATESLGADSGQPGQGTAARDCHRHSRHPGGGLERRGESAQEGLMDPVARRAIVTSSERCPPAAGQRLANNSSMACLCSGGPGPPRKTKKALLCPNHKRSV